MWRVEMETKAEVEVGSSGGDKAGGVGDNTWEGGADKSAAYSSSPVARVSRKFWYLKHQENGGASKY